jgi:hypothetical protein
VSRQYQNRFSSMIYSSYTFQECYSAISPLQAYFLPSHKNWEASVLGKLPYVQIIERIWLSNVSKNMVLLEFQLGKILGCPNFDVAKKREKKNSDPF